MKYANQNESKKICIGRFNISLPLAQVFFKAELQTFLTYYYQARVIFKTVPYENRIKMFLKPKMT